MHQSEGAGQVNVTERFIFNLYSPFTDPGSESAHLFPAAPLCRRTAHVRVMWHHGHDTVGTAGGLLCMLVFTDTNKGDAF